jgi:hypothetical protein
MIAMKPLDELPPQLGGPKLDKTTAALIAALAADAARLEDPGAHLFGEIALLQRQPTVEGKLAQRERYLDRLHANLEADPSPKKPVRVSLFPHGGARIVFYLDSLKKRKKRTPSERERRRLLGIQLADFLTAGGL